MKMNAMSTTALALLFGLGVGVGTMPVAAQQAEQPQAGQEQQQQLETQQPTAAQPGQMEQADFQQIEQALEEVRQALQQQDFEGAEQALDQAHQAVQQAQQQQMGAMEQPATGEPTAEQPGMAAEQPAMAAEQQPGAEEEAQVTVVQPEGEPEVTVTREEPAAAEEPTEEPAVAQQPTEQPAVGVEEPTETAEPTVAQPEAEPESPLYTMRADDIIGTNIVNEQGENIGSVGDLVLDMQDETVYALVEVGGFLGIGAREVALPLEQMEFTQDDELLLHGVTQEQLEQMPEYEEGQYQALEREQPIGQQRTGMAGQAEQQPAAQQ